MPFITVTYPPKYPLTESEKKWLEERKQYIQQYSSETFCKYCYYVKEVPKGWACDADICPTDKRDHDYEDAAEFEARVAAKLAQGVSYGELPCGADPDCPDKAMDKYNTKETPTKGCQMCVLRAARLTIEVEMEKY